MFPSWRSLLCKHLNAHLQRVEFLSIAFFFVTQHQHPVPWNYQSAVSSHWVITKKNLRLICENNKLMLSTREGERTTTDCKCKHNNECANIIIYKHYWHFSFISFQFMTLPAITIHIFIFAPTITAQIHISERAWLLTMVDGIKDNKFKEFCVTISLTIMNA